MRAAVEQAAHGELKRGAIPCIALDELKRLIDSGPPAGTEVARACQYDELGLARLCGCSFRKLQRVFGETGYSPGRWLLEHRLLCALEKLTYLDSRGELESIKIVAIEAGFRHPEHFERLFKKTFGQTPTEFLTERERALLSLGIDLEDCRAGRLSFPIIEVRCPHLGQ